LTWFAGWWRNHQPKRAEKPHSKSSGRKTLDGPATRPGTPLAVENGVGKPAAPETGAPNAGAGKREWRTPIPHLSLLDRKVGQGLIVFSKGIKTLIIKGILGSVESGNSTSLPRGILRGKSVEIILFYIMGKPIDSSVATRLEVCQST
jgi:hypothetical protein